LEAFLPEDHAKGLQNLDFDDISALIPMQLRDQLGSQSRHLHLQTGIYRETLHLYERLSRI